MYILYFQEPGVAEQELDPQARSVMRKILYSASGSIDPGHFASVDMTAVKRFTDAMIDPARLPGWLTEEDLEVYVAEFERTGFRGGLNWYRNFDRNWELLAPFAGAKIRVPALFVGGLRDLVVTGPDSTTEGPMVAMLGSFCEDLRGKVLIEGAGHWNQQESPGETNAALLDFLAGLAR